MPKKVKTRKKIKKKAAKRTRKYAARGEKAVSTPVSLA